MDRREGDDPGAAMTTTSADTDFLTALPGRLGGTDLPSQINSLLEEAIVSGALQPGQRLREGLARRARFYFATVSESLGRGWVETHEHLLDAVERQDGDVAERISREHIEETGHAVERLLAPASD